ncbi:hypothetical protein BDB00DRAFT_871308 [Zychaea mexicana]|uniref:uncharacterized protein n=1 Tax=Zychaea mexicana TaxID=64656 RepID=UPI0022FDD66D|nr:uncharacterized protein BDB00DRAFT_871308 [Zychaea mexicana]KAI9494475.1 hypothetical protein BDB00DRAFT_871308 [Zychaea mexicana]
MAANSKDAERKLNQNIDKASGAAQDEVSRLRAELDDLRARARPKVEEAESFLTSPSALGFYKGVVVVLGYAKANGGLRL